MNDQPLTYRIDCSDPRTAAAELLREGVIGSCNITGPRTVEITTTDASAFRRRLPAICSAGSIRLEELNPLDAISRASSATWWVHDHGKGRQMNSADWSATDGVDPGNADARLAGRTPGRSVRTPGAFLALYRLVLRHQITRGRLALFAVIGALSVTLGWVIGRSSTDRTQDATDFVSLFGLGLIVPVVALVLGSAALGNWVEDETLVYVWLRPVKRWVVAVAATLAVATVALPVIVGSMVSSPRWPVAATAG